VDKINHSWILTKTRAGILLLILFFPFLLWVLNKIPVMTDYGLVLYGLESVYYSPANAVLPELFAPLEMGLIVPGFVGRLITFFVYFGAYFSIIRIKDLLAQKNNKHMMKITVLVGIIISAPFVYFDVYIYRGPFCFSFALILFVLNVMISSLFIVRLSGEKLFCVSLWRVFLVSAIIFSPVFGYAGNYILLCNIEKFADSVPVGIKNTEIYNGRELSEDVRLFLLENSEQPFSIMPSEQSRGILIVFEQYSLFGTKCSKRAFFHLKDMRWEYPKCE
jgi:hypothetical protein